MSDTAANTTEEDRRFDDEEYNPTLEPKKARAWLNLLEESEKAFEDWNDHCDKIDKMYANLARLAKMGRDKEFQMLWANIEIEKPVIYARQPMPVVVTKFKDRRPVYQAAAELLERCDTVAFDLMKIDSLMKLVRDDLVIAGRGVAWARYEGARDMSKGYRSYYETERVCVDFKHRRDFLHSISRNWFEVTWVAAASYLTRGEARKRFRKYSNDCYQDAEYVVDKDGKEVGGADKRERAKFWEIWDKKNQRVVWVAKGCEDILDEDDPHLDLQNFFPCPEPAYGNVQRGSLVPVPDVLQYKDQLDELNLLTAKIHALSDALEAKGFYPAGGAELGDAIQAAIATKTPGRLLVPISNWAAFGGSKEVIVWLPMAEIAQTIQSLIATRKEIIQDIYQIKGLSDIMRGSTDPRETLGSQELKSQFGSTRTKDKQGELVRIARDLVEITSDIIVDQFEDETIIFMSQTQLPTDAMKRKQVGELQQQLGQQQQAMQLMQQLPQFQQAQQQNPDQVQQVMGQAQQMMQAGQQAMESIIAKPTFEQVMTFLRDNRARSFTLDIETDSTILIDENTEKQRRAEFTGVLAQLLPQLTQMVQAEPATAQFAGEVLKFTTAPYRVGRALDSAIDGLVDQLEQKVNQPRGDDPTTAAAKTQLQIEQMKDQTTQKRDQADNQLKQLELKQKQEAAHAKLMSTERIQFAKLQHSNQDNAAKAQQANLEAMHSREEHQQEMLQGAMKMREGEQKMMLGQQVAQQKQADMQQRSQDRRDQSQARIQQQNMRQFPRGAA
jgi:hypothetical protein